MNSSSTLSSSDAALVEHIVSMRRRVCPRTSYATSGTAASVAYILTTTQRTGAAQLISQGLKTSGEFDTVVVHDRLSDLARSVNGNVILLYGCITPEAQQTVQSIFENSKLKLAVLVWFTEETGISIDAAMMGRFEQRELNCEKYHIVSCYNYKKLVADSLVGFNGQPSVQSRAQYKYLWGNNSAHAEQGKERVLQRLADKTLYGSANTKLTVQQWDGLVQQCIANNVDDYGIYDMIRQKVLGSTLAADLQKSIDGKLGAEPVAKVEAEEDGRANHMVSRTLESIPARLRQPRALRRMLDYGCAEGAITAALGKHLGLTPNCILGADVRTIPSLGFTFIPLAAEDTGPPALRAILPSIEDESVDLITSAMVFHHVTHIKSVLLELRRIVSRKGALVIREHHCVSADMGAFLDITHGLYSLSWSSPVEWPDFVTEYKAFYRSREQWDALLAEAGFTLCIEECGHQALANYRAAEWATRKPNGTFPNVIKAYYAVYKPTPGFRDGAVKIDTTDTAESCIKRSNVMGNSATSSIGAPSTSSTAGEQPAGKRVKYEYETQLSSSVGSAAPPPKVAAAPPAPAVAPATPAASDEIHESKKYPGKFYRTNKLTGATEWV